MVMSNLDQGKKMQCSEWKRLTVKQEEIIEKHLLDAPIKLGKLAKELGLLVKISSLESGISGEIKPDQTAQSGFMIRINRHEIKTRQRFTLAHEISHFLLHRNEIGDGLEDDILYRSSLSDQREAQANRLAADLIMPWPLIREYLQELKEKSREEIIETLSDKFKVSEIAMKIRLGF